MHHFNVEVAFPSPCLLGEGALWDERSERLHWVDILGHKAFAFDPANGSNLAFDVGELVGTVVLSENSQWVLGLKSGFAWLNPDTGKVTAIADPESDNPVTRLNDGKCDPKGRFWVGSVREGKGELGGLYCLEPDLSFSQKLSGIHCSNGLVWTRDARTFYYIDTPTHEVWAFDYEPETGAIGNQRTLVRFPEGQGAPDGMTIDAQDRLWIALWGGSKVVCFNPSSNAFEAEIALPAKNVTSCAFGGPELNDLYITTARVGIDADRLAVEPLTGSLFRVRLPYQGVAATRFARTL